MTIKSHHHIISLILFVLVFVAACSPAKRLDQGEYLLDDYKIEDKRSGIPKEAFRNYIKQKPNKEVFGYKFWLHIYNLAGTDESKGINRWLRNIGEAPVVFSSNLTDNTAQQLELFLFNEGFFNSEVYDSVQFKGQKAKVKYILEPEEPYTIREIDYFFQDAALTSYILKDTANAILKSGDRFDQDNFQAENIRIERLLRNNGYYNFSRDYISYEVDTTVGNHQLDVVMEISNFPEYDTLGNLIRTSHPVYSIRNVFLKVGAGRGNPDNVGSVALDTLRFDSIYIVDREKLGLESSLITQKNYIIPGELFNARRVQQTYRNLTALSAIRLVDVHFTEQEEAGYLLDCEITMQPAVRQAFTGGIEGTTSGGNIGAAGNLNYQHRNLFGGSERFDVTLLGAIESLPENPESEASSIGTMEEVGVEAKLSIPQFILPFKTDQFIRKYNPETEIDLAYNFQQRPDFTRSTFRSSFGYRWRGNSYVTHVVYPIDISLINTPFIDPEFENWLKGTYLYYSYLPHFITDQRYRLIFSNQRLNREIDFYYFRFGFETAGNIMYGLFKAFGNPDNDAVLQLFGVDYAQYIRTDIDIRHYDYREDDVSLVYRFFAGAAVPYLNSTAIPFEKQFFGGGANSIRAWRVKTLGPGTYAGDSNFRYPNQTADFKLEANIEYRFPLFWVMEGALFADAGNIWSLSPDDDRVGALFELDDFYKEFAVGTGFGFRFDFDFFVFRFDLGIPLVDPSYPEGARWIPSNYELQGSDLGYNFAIGYPF